MDNKTSEEYEEDVSLKAFIVLSRSFKSIRKRVEEDIKDLGLNPTEFAVLELVYNKGDQPIQKIGEKVLIASSSITYVVDKLEQKNLIERKPCDSDRRVTFAVITSAGIDLMDTVFPKHKAQMNEIFGGLDSEEKENLIELLKKLGFHAEDM